MDTMYDQLDFFNTFLSNTTEKQIFIESFAKKFNTPKPFQILDLGCNEGVLTLKLLDQIQPFLSPDSLLVGVDPCENAVNAFAQKPLPDNLSACFHAETAEAFLDKNTKVFDWTIASHCLYWSDDLERTVEMILQSARSGVIVLRGAYGVNQLQVQFKDWLGDPTGKQYVADDLEPIFESLNCPVVREDHESIIHIPPHESPWFRELVAFCLLTTNEQLDEDRMHAVSQYLRPYGDALRHDISFFWFGEH